jgi:hypothetical protein
LARQRQRRRQAHGTAAAHEHVVAGGTRGRWKVGVGHRVSLALPGIVARPPRHNEVAAYDAPALIHSTPCPDS